MAKRVKKSELAKSSDEDRTWAEFLGVDDALLSLARAGKLELPEWWDEIFGDGEDVPVCSADAYREAQILLEIGVDLTGQVAAACVEKSGIAKRRRKDRRSWEVQLSFLLCRVGVELAGVAPDGRSGWQQLVDAGFLSFVERRDGEGSRATVTTKGAKWFAAARGAVGEAWSFSSSGCRAFLCLLATRLRKFSDRQSSTRRRDIIASDEVARLELGLSMISEDELFLQLARVGVVTNDLRGVARSSADLHHNAIAADRKRIRDSGDAHLRKSRKVCKSVHPGK